MDCHGYFAMVNTIVFEWTELTNQPHLKPLLIKITN